ncbi:MAG: hypothetical protein AABW54_00365 [Candidatus Micrarchaeota archaeon]
MPSRNVSAESIPIVAIGPHASVGGCTNFVLVRRRFGSLNEFSSFATKLFGRFPAGEPHHFDFSEHPFFRNFVAERLEVKRELHALSTALALHHPHSVVSFSVFERARGYRRSGSEVVREPALSNTGYVVTSEGWKVFSKVRCADGDARVLKRASSSPAERRLLGRTWARRAGYFKALKPPVVELGGRKVEHRVCRDANLPPGSEESLITVVSANEIPAGVYRLLSSKRKLVLVNDLNQEDDHGRRAAAAGFNYHLDNYTEWDKSRGVKMLKDLLARERVRIHLAG